MCNFKVCKIIFLNWVNYDKLRGNKIRTWGRSRDTDFKWGTGMMGYFAMQCAIPLRKRKESCPIELYNKSSSVIILAEVITHKLGLDPITPAQNHKYSKSFNKITGDNYRVRQFCTFSTTFWLFHSLLARRDD